MWTLILLLLSHDKQIKRRSNPNNCIHVSAKAPATLSSSSQRVNVPILPAPKVIRAGVLIYFPNPPSQGMSLHPLTQDKKGKWRVGKKCTFKEETKARFRPVGTTHTLMHLQYLPYPCVYYSRWSIFTTIRLHYNSSSFLLHNLCNWWFTSADQENNN